MVYCTRCGVKNPDDAKYCDKCGAKLEVSIEESLERRAEEWGGRVEKRIENECFGLPKGGEIFGLVIGAIIIIFGLQQVFGWSIDVGSLATISIGILIVAGALYNLRRRRR